MITSPIINYSRSLTFLIVHVLLSLEAPSKSQRHQERVRVCEEDMASTLRINSDSIYNNNNSLNFGSNEPLCSD